MTNDLLSIGYRVHDMEELKYHVPAAFATHPKSDVTDKYSFLQTDVLIQNILDEGWELHSGKQNGPNDTARHFVRFTNPKLGFMSLKGSEKVKPQIILDNSHDRGSSAQVHMGLFRLVCSNGLVIAMPGMYTNVKFRHMGVNKEELALMLQKTAEQYSVIGHHVNDMQLIDMHKDQQEQFAIKAIAKREPHLFINDDGTINVEKVTISTNPLEIIKPIRGEDEATNLWTTFNVIQERMIKGGYNRKSPSGRNSSTRGISNATRNVELNRELWTIAEEYMPV